MADDRDDVAIIGTGAGGAVLAHLLAPSGLPDEPTGHLDAVVPSAAAESGSAVP